MANQFKVYDLIANNVIYNTGNQLISGVKIFSDSSIFSGLSITAPNQTISGTSSILNKGLADSLYGINYFSITTGLSSGVDNNITGEKVHFFTLPSGTYEFECFASLSGTVETGGQGMKFYLYPNNIYSFYGQAKKTLGINYFTGTEISSLRKTNDNLNFCLYNTSDNLTSACMINGILNINQQTEIPIFISQNIQETGQPVYLLEGSYLKARKLS